MCAWLASDWGGASMDTKSAVPGTPNGKVSASWNWLKSRRKSLGPLAISTIAVNLVSIVVVLSPIFAAKDTPNWFLLVVSWVLLILTVCLVRVYRFGTELRRIDSEVATILSDKAALSARIGRDDRMFSRFDDFHSSFHHLRDAHQHLLNYLDKDDADQERFWDPESRSTQHEIVVALVKFAQFYADHTGHVCHATIKQFVPGDTNDFQLAEAVTIFRSHPEGVPRRFQRSLIVDNSDFTDILLTGDRYFFANDVTALAGYRNPHLDRSNPRYRSVIVWPIRITPGDDPRDQPDTIGFLCLDSPDADVFVEAQHVFLGAGFADSLWAVLRLYATCDLRPRVASEEVN
jgi:hypothetical protein